MNKRVEVEIGVQYNMLTAIEFIGVDKRGSYLYNCLCECGKKKVVVGYKLVRGDIKSCGCLKHRSKRLDLSGKIFGGLLVLTEHDKTKGGNWRWKCKCQCGNVIVVRSGDLTSGHTNSCGCLCKERLAESRFIDITGKKFGKLTVIGRCGTNKHAAILWNCLCKCGNEFIAVGSDLKSGHTKSCGCSQYGKEEHNSNWKGGVNKYDLPLFETYADRLSYVDDIRKSIDNSYGCNLLEVKCTYCGNWYIPSRTSVISRISSLEGVSGECRLYCSDSCKQACPTYRQVKYPKGFKPSTSREVQPELRKLVFERDGWRCVVCGKGNDMVSLHCHHIDPVINNPVESADIDNCITLCKKHHVASHKKPGCTNNELRCS